MFFWLCTDTRSREAHHAGLKFCHNTEKNEKHSFPSFPHGDRVLCESIFKNDWTKAASLINSNIGLDYIDPYGRRILQVAIEHNIPSTLLKQILDQPKQNPNFKDFANARSLLSIATKLDCTCDIFHLLLCYHANPLQNDKFSKNALFYALQSKLSQEKLFILFQNINLNAELECDGSWIGWEGKWRIGEKLIWQVKSAFAISSVYRFGGQISPQMMAYVRNRWSKEQSACCEAFDLQVKTMLSLSVVLCRRLPSEILHVLMGFLFTKPVW